MNEELVQRQVFARYAQHLPDAWFALASAGCFDSMSEAHLQLSDLQWMNAEAILAWRFPADTIDGLMPFAATSNEDLWCFGRMLPEFAGENPIVFCPHEDEVAFAYAPHFRGFIFRAVIEEYACTCLTDAYSPGRSLAILGDYASLVGPYLPKEWAAIVREVASRPLIELEHGYFGTLSAEEAQIIIKDAFAAWPDLEREFEQFLGN